MPIEATKNGVTRIFSDEQWKNMGKDKFGWKAGAPIQDAAPVDESIIIKKKVADVVPDEIIPPKPIEIPNEIKRKPGRQPNVQLKK